ncbi:MAG TPA: TonB-dependent receptor, partial [Allosphingosinicella sp.]
MHIPLLAAAVLAAQQSPAPAPEETIVITASREPVEREQSSVSATVFDRETVEALGLPLTSDVLRLAPGVSVASSGPRGTLTQIRIRGAEANHSLLFVDGIEFNDPAASNAARFELLTSDSVSRIEIVRGPQSALWGSEALGGVVALETGDGLKGRRLAALAEYGSLDSSRTSIQAAQRFGNFGISGGAGLVGSDGVDSFGHGSERDGFNTRSANVKAVFAPLPHAELGVVGHWIGGESQFDGQDLFGRRINSLDSTRNEIFAARSWAKADLNDWSFLGDVSILDSSNRNSLGDEPLNSTFGQRLAAGGQVSRKLGRHRLTGAAEYEREDFRTEGQAVFGAPDQDRSRSLTAFVGEWRAEWAHSLVTDVALRHDDFSGFEGATTVRASVLLGLAAGWTLSAAYGEGIAQPEFYDLYGFYPDSFVGNPDLKP